MFGRKISTVLCFNFLYLWIRASDTILSVRLYDHVEPTTGIEPVNLFLTKEVLYRLSYVGQPRVFEPLRNYSTNLSH